MNGSRVKAARLVRRTAVAIVGSGIVFAGIVMIPLPVPSFVVIPAGLAVLATEFAWARGLLEKVNAAATKVRERARNTVKRFGNGG